MNDDTPRKERVHMGTRTNRQRRLTALVLCVCLLLGSLGGTSLLAATVSTGEVVGIDPDSVLNVRSGPGTQYGIVGKLKNGDTVTILETSGSWYKISAGSLTGYVSAAYIHIHAQYDSDQDFEAYLTAQGFPESYKPALRQLHAQYPRWVFKARHLTMTWAEALQGESPVGLNTIQSPEAWKSMEYGAYNWDTKAYVSFDSGGWCAAAPAVIAYYMDPRNFLDGTYIFQFEELSYSADQTVEGIKAILPAELHERASQLLQAAKETGVSAYFLATKIVQEGTVKNGLALGKVPGYEGYYNFFDIGAYAADGKSAVENGAIYAKNHGWSDPYKCMVDSANMLGNNYIKRGQDTPYFQKFNVTNAASGLYRHQYMTNVVGAASEGKIRGRTAVRDAGLVFSVPVYREMPAASAAYPPRNGNNNNLLDDIAVSGCTLTPTFDRYTMAYALQVGSAVESVQVSAKLNNSNAKLTGGGTVRLNHGENRIELTVTATSGATRTYTVIITREGSSSGQKPAITGKTYTVGTTITKVEPGTGVSAFLNALAVQNGTAAVYTAAGAEKPTGIVATGDIVRLYSGTAVTASYPVVIYGDVNGDGRVAPVDALRIQKHIIGLTNLSGMQLLAADTNRDGRVQPVDALRVLKYCIEMIKSLQ